MTNAWDAVRAAIDAEDAAAVATLVAGLDDAQRRQVARELPGYLPIAREAGRLKDLEREREREARRADLERRARAQRRSVYELPGWEDLFVSVVGMRWTEPMRVAGAGALAGAAAVASWLGRRDLDRGWEPADCDDVPLILQVVAARPAEWQRDLAVRLALRLRGTRPQADRRVRLALELLRRTGAEPPAHAPLTLAWVATASTEDLAADPLLGAMVPTLFEAEGVGPLLSGDQNWPAALVELAGSGRIEREALLNGCRSRFLLGGDSRSQRFFVRLHDLLDPSAEEVAPHLRDYLAVLGSAPVNVAEAALRQIRRVGGVSPVEAGDAVAGLLFRAEGRLVRAGVVWLDRLLKDPTEEVDAYAPALATALTCASADARERGVKLAVKHAGRFGPAAAELIRDAVATLPAEQGAALAAVFGGEPAPEPETERFVPGTLPPVFEPRPMPPPIETPEALVRLRLQEFDWISSELWLDGFVRMTARYRTGADRDRWVKEVDRLARRCDDRSYRFRPWWNTGDWAAAMARETVEPGAERRALPDGRLLVSERVPDMRHGQAWKIMPLARYAEVYQAQVDGRLPPYLLATPTRYSGVLDADVLVERLEGYERAGVTALPLDLRQALLRLGRTVSGEVAERAARLTGEAGRKVARWLTDRPAEPQVVLRWESHEGDPRVESEFVSGPEYQEVLGDLLVPRLHEESCKLLLAVLAGHRELAAARSAYALRSYWPMSRPSLMDLELLVTAEGPGGPGLALILAHYLMEGPDGGAVPSLLRLAATGDLPGEDLGRQLADLLKRTETSPADAIAALREAAEQGAHREIWQVMSAMLPAYLPGPGERATTAHTRLLRFAADVAEWADAQGESAVIAELAARNRSSELVRQARRLHHRLTVSPAGR